MSCAASGPVESPEPAVAAETKTQSLRIWPAPTPFRRVGLPFCADLLGGSRFCLCSFWGLENGFFGSQGAASDGLWPLLRRLIGDPSQRAVVATAAANGFGPGLRLTARAPILPPSHPGRMPGQTQVILQMQKPPLLSWGST